MSPYSHGGEITSNMGHESCWPASMQVPPLECVVRPGEVMYVPSGWWHACLNLDTMTVAGRSMEKALLDGSCTSSAGQGLLHSARQTCKAGAHAACQRQSPGLLRCCCSALGTWAWLCRHTHIDSWVDLLSSQPLCSPCDTSSCAHSPPAGLVLPAVTQNFVSSVNLTKVLSFLRPGRAELVSGCAPEQR